MPASGMRYKKTLDLVEQIKEKQEKMHKVLDSLNNERTAEVGSVYGGTAATNFKDNVRKIAETMDAQINEIIKNLTTEAETQHAAYIAQEQKLQSKIQLPQ